MDTGGGRFRFPLVVSNKPGKGANINLSIEEDHIYHLNKVNITGMNFFHTNEVVLKLLQMDTGDVFSTSKLRHGFDDLGKYYGMFGFIDFVPTPEIMPIPDSDKIDLTLDFDEEAPLLRSPVSSISPATPPRATKSSAASCTSTKATSSISTCGR